MKYDKVKSQISKLRLKGLKVAIKNGQKTFNFGIKVPDAKAEEVETAIRDHAQWMRETHSLDESKIQLVHYYASKSPDFKNPMNPEEGTTGHVVFSINEVYVTPEGIGEHLAAAQEWSGFPSFFSMLSTYGDVLVLSGDVIETL